MRFRRGQVALYLLVVLVAIALLALLNVDVFTAVRGKMRVENAGDAAALAAARCQGELLNQIGRLNLEHLGAALSNDFERCAEIELQQRRYCLLGPIDALRAANAAAKRNAQPVEEDFAAILRQHVADIRTIYAGGNGAADPYPESWPGAWSDYALEIEQALGEGLAVGADNIEFYGYVGGHMLLNRDFYQAVAGRNWCWFKWHAWGLLESYAGWRSWPPIPVREDNALENSEIFSLHLEARRGSIASVLSEAELLKLLDCSPKQLQDSCILTNDQQTWFFYESSAWREWSEMNPLAGSGDYGAMPLVGEVRPEFNVRGAAAICRCVYDTTAVALDSESTLTWSGAAKPFGSLEGEEGELVPVNSFHEFVLPAFDAVRLVPLDSVGGRDLATADFEWIQHLREHVGDYLLNGPRARSCFYCQQLVIWERASFREQGRRWLHHYAETCRRPTGGGSAHGGTAHGH